MTVVIADSVANMARNLREGMEPARKPSLEGMGPRQDKHRRETVPTWDQEPVPDQSGTGPGSELRPGSELLPASGTGPPTSGRQFDLE